MKCKYPIVVDQMGMIVSCKQCLSCQINKKRVLTSRILFESIAIGEASFVTLTYENDVRAVSLKKDDVQRWQKRLRKLAQKKLRFYTIGEYGEKKQRAHYHSIVFGINPLDLSNYINDSWSENGKLIGFTYIGTCTKDSAAYVAGYVTKKATKQTGELWLMGRAPEFAISSNRPGIGATAIPAISQALETKHGHRSMVTTGDVPTELVLEAKKIPLGSYMRSKIREYLDFPKTSKTSRNPQNSYYRVLQKEKMRKLFTEGYEEAKKAGVKHDKKFFLEGWIQKRVATDIKNIEDRFKIYDSRYIE